MEELWRIEVLVRGTWLAVAPYKGDPYTYERREEAEAMARMCYPDQIREDRLEGLTLETGRRVRLALTKAKGERQ
jgi:hypothetical protein